MKAKAARHHEFRVAVGTVKGRRSTVWKFIVRENNIYILSRMMGAEMKVSLHESGMCQYSFTDPWVKMVPGRRNRDRHIAKWLMPRPTGTAAVHAFRIQIPGSELRVVDNAEDLSGVFWLPTPPRSKVTCVDCFLSPPSLDDPSPARRVVHSHQLTDRRWLVILRDELPLNLAALEALRSEVLAAARKQGVSPRPEYRMDVFQQLDPTRGDIIELCACPEEVGDSQPQGHPVLP